MLVAAGVGPVHTHVVTPGPQTDGGTSLAGKQLLVATLSAGNTLAAVNMAV